MIFRVGFDSHVLRFAARLISDEPADSRRYFIIKYFLCDDTIGVFELGERNSGFKASFVLYFNSIIILGVSLLTQYEKKFFDFVIYRVVNFSVATRCTCQTWTSSCRRSRRRTRTRTCGWAMSWSSTSTASGLLLLTSTPCATWSCTQNRWIIYIQLKKIYF